MRLLVFLLGLTSVGAFAQSEPGPSCRDRTAVECVTLGEVAEAEDESQDYGLAAVFYEEACLMGHSMGCLRFGSLALKGKGVSPKLARKAQRKRIAMLHSPGVATLLPIRKTATIELGVGTSLASFRPVLHPSDRASAFYTRACELGDGGSCYKLGMERLSEGRFPRKKAKAFIERSCTLGNTEACDYTKTPCFAEPEPASCGAHTIEGGVVAMVAGSVSGNKDHIVVDAAEFKLAKREQPEISTDLQAFLADIGEPECQLQVVMDVTGVPIEVTPTRCLVKLHESAKACVAKWRWKIPKDMAERGRPIQTVVKVVYY